MVTVTTIVRIVSCFLFGGFLLFRWWKTEKRYFTDFAFLMSIPLITLGFGKILDLVLYESFGDIATFEEINFIVGDPRFRLAQVRWLLMLGFSIPVTTLMLTVWLQFKPRLRTLIIVVFSGTWVTLILAARNYATLKLYLPLMVIPPALLSAVTFLIVYRQKRLPELNSLLLGVGYLAFTVTQATRPVFMSLGTPPFGLFALAEVLETIVWTLIFASFVTKPPFLKRVKPADALGIPSADLHAPPITH